MTGKYGGYVLLMGVTKTRMGRDFGGTACARVHADYAGPMEGKMFLILVDAHSKWMEVAVMSSATSTSTIERMRVMFATHGLPEVLVTNNGSVFTSQEFEEFIKKNGIRHVKFSLYLPASNGLV